MRSTSEYLPVIQKLLEKTRQARVHWQGGLGTFYCTIGSESDQPVKFTLSTTSTRDINYDVRFLAMDDAQGNELFRIESTDLPTSVDEEATSTMVEELYELARGQALNIGQKLDLASTLLDRV